MPKLDLPKNPIEKAKREKAQAEAAPYGYGHGLRDPLASLISDIPFFDPIISQITRKRWLRVEGNTITVWVEDLLHTREVAFCEVVLAPLVEGSFEIKATVICEEFESPEGMTFPLTITWGTVADLPLLHGS